MKWRCPRCFAPEQQHGRGPCKWRDTDHGYYCDGFLCHCEIDGAIEDINHGFDATNPCKTAQCHHCGWRGQFPPNGLDVITGMLDVAVSAETSPITYNFKPEDLKGWAKQAWDAGWRPAADWTPPPPKKKDK